ncbi:MAG: tyrosine-type recombinase/integrase [Acidobacteria bacterium]|nr:tyrosine-type recombinase/integrase [Acidobacteriota bacterium]
MDVVAETAPRRRRTKRRGRHPEKALSAAFVRSAPPGRHADGNGLYLFVQSTGTRSWVQRIVIRGRRRELGLGAAGLVSLAEARELALANRKLARSGGDPLSEKRRAEGVPTFAEAAERVLEQKRGGWRGRWHAQNWWTSMERYVFPRIGRRPVSEVSTADVLEILTPIWHVKAETARAVRQRIRSVIEWAIALDMRNDNPCDRVLPVLGPQNDIVTHRRALSHKDVAAAIKAVRTGSAQPAVRLAFEFLVLTAARSGEVRLAAWDEIDTAGAVWTVPATRMKAKREHRVPLCGPALEILEAARTLGDGNRLVFPMRSGKSISTSTLPKMLQHHGIAAVPHGFRSSFRDWAAEETDHPRDVIEVALAHVVQNKVEAAYARSDLFERRRRLMDDWGAYLDTRPTLVLARSR